MAAHSRGLKIIEVGIFLDPVVHEQRNTDQLDKA